MEYAGNGQGYCAIQSGSSPQFSISNPQQVLPLAKVTLEAHAFGKLVISSVSNSGLPAKKRTAFANGRRWCKGVTNLIQAEDTSPLGSSPLSGP
jgi:hypothetical protein